MKDKFYTLHDLVDNLTEYLELTPEQQFRVTAKIKRLIHKEKQNVYYRYSLYAQGPGMYDRTDPENPIHIGYEAPQDPFLHNILSISAVNHAEWAKKTDEEIVTWDIGTHKFKQGE